MGYVQGDLAKLLEDLSSSRDAAARIPELVKLNPLVEVELETVRKLLDVATYAAHQLKTVQALARTLKVSGEVGPVGARTSAQLRSELEAYNERTRVSVLLRRP